MIQSLHRSLLSAGHQSIVCYGRGKACYEDRSIIRISHPIESIFHATMTRLTGYQGKYSYFSTRKLINIISRFNPDVIHLFSLHGYYLNEFELFSAIKNHGIKTIYSMIDEYPYMGKCTNPLGCNKFETMCFECPQTGAYPKSLFFDRSSAIFNKKKDSYKDIYNIIFTGPQWVINRAKRSALLSDKKFAVIDEFTDLENMFYPRNPDVLRKRLGIPKNKKIVLNVGPFLYERKGGIYFLNSARMLINENIVFIHIGYDGSKKELPENFLPVDYLTDQNQLAEYYSLADLFVCPSLADTMPNVCLEALSCGTPVCGFDIEGVPFVATPEYGTFVPSKDLDSLASVIKSAPIKSKERSKACRSYAQTRYSRQIYFEKIMKLYTSGF